MRSTRTIVAAVAALGVAGAVQASPAARAAAPAARVVHGFIAPAPVIIGPCGGPVLRPGRAVVERKPRSPRRHRPLILRRPC